MPLRAIRSRSHRRGLDIFGLLRPFARVPVLRLSPPSSFLPLLSSLELPSTLPPPSRAVSSHVPLTFARAPLTPSLHQRHTHWRQPGLSPTKSPSPLDIPCPEPRRNATRSLPQGLERGPWPRRLSASAFVLGSTPCAAERTVVGRTEPGSLAFSKGAGLRMRPRFAPDAALALARSALLKPATLAAGRTDRKVVIGTSVRDRVLYVVHVERGQRDRISARPATRP